MNQGGKLILEPQDLKGYQKRSHMTPTMKQNFKNIKLAPNMFQSFLLSPQVGFVSCEDCCIEMDKSNGFSRRILVFTK